MSILPLADILAIHDKAVAIGLPGRRPAMMTNIPYGFVGSLPNMPDAIAQQYVDLGQMNQDINLVIADGLTPLNIWLTNAAAFSSQYPPIQKFMSQKATEVAGRAAGLVACPARTPPLWATSPNSPNGSSAPAICSRRIFSTVRCRRHAGSSVSLCRCIKTSSRACR